MDFTLTNQLLVPETFVQHNHQRSYGLQISKLDSLAVWVEISVQISENEVFLPA